MPCSSCWLPTRAKPSIGRGVRQLQQGLSSGPALVPAAPRVTAVDVADGSATLTVEGDLDGQPMTGRVVLARLSAEFPDLPVSMLTTSADERDVLDTLAAGARGYLLKDMEPDDLIRALRDLAGGRTVVSPELTAVLARAVRGENLPESEPHWTPYADLTPREREILCHLAEGQSNKVIAKALGISDGTVKLHVKSILRKLSVHSRVEAAVMAVEHDLCGRNRAREARERQPSSDG